MLLRKIAILTIICFFSFLWLYVRQPIVYADSTSWNTLCLNPSDLQPDPLHHKRLTGSGFPTNTDIYIVLCIGDPNNNQCTAGSANTRLAGLGMNLTPVAGEQLSVEQGNPIRSSDGNVDVEVHGDAPRSTQGRFFGLFQSGPPTPTATGVLNNRTQGGDQQGTFTAPPPAQIGDAKNCIPIVWDPYGRIFDSQSLEPLPSINVELLDQNKNHYQQFGIQNPQSTAFDGAFSFYVVNGTYYLSPSKSSYQFPLFNSDINPNYNKAYFDLYESQNPILEQNTTIHIDIPMKPLSTPYHGAPVLMEYGLLALPGAATTLIEGKVSHPLTIVIMMQNNQEVVSTTADKFGFFRLLVNNNQLSSSFPLTIRLIKVDLTNNAQGQPTQDLLSINPPLRYIAGYAYDLNGNILSSVTVAIRLMMNGTTYYTTSADEKGFFTISSDHIPPFSYYLSFYHPGLPPIDMSTLDFVKKNQNYLRDVNLNLLTAQRFGQAAAGKSSSTTSSWQAFNSPVLSRFGNNPSALYPTNGTSSSPILMALLLISGLGIIIIILWYLKVNKKRGR